MSDLPAWQLTNFSAVVYSNICSICHPYEDRKICMVILFGSGGSELRLSAEVASTCLLNDIWRGMLEFEDIVEKCITVPRW